MNKALVGIALLTAATAGLAGCGSSGGTPPVAPTASLSSGAATGQTNTAICVRLKQDVLAVGQEMQTPAQSPSQSATHLEALVQKLTSDAHLGSPTLQAGVTKYTEVLTAAAEAAQRGTMPDMRTISAKAQSAERDLIKACPNIGPGSG